MLLRDIKKEDLFFATTMIRRINRSAEAYFTYAHKENKMEMCKVNEEGVVTFINEDDFYVCQISFTDDIFDDQLIDCINQEIKKMLNQSNKPLYINMNLKNQKIIDYYLEHGCKPDMFGIEFRLKKEEFESIHYSSSGIRFSKLDETEIDQYIQLLDEAFNPIDEKKGYKNYYSQNKEIIKKQLIEADQHDDFRVLYVNNELVGLYTLYKDYIKDIAVKPSMQNKGYGKILLHKCLDVLFNERDYDTVYLRTETINENAFQFYISNGFTVTGRFAETTYTR